jgi:hypothetical protein
MTKSNRWWPAALILIACARDSVDLDAEEVVAASAPLTQTEQPAQPSVRSVPVEARVPDTLGGEADCATTWDAPTACEWRSSVDAIVLGTVQAVRLVTADPYGRTDAGWQKVPGCKAVNPALAFQVRVERSFGARLSSVVDVAVGSEQVQRFRPLPLRGNDGELVWTLLNGEVNGPLKDGARVLVGLHRVGAGWSLMGDALWGIDGNGALHVTKRNGDCTNASPEQLDGLSIAALSEILSSCGGADGARADQRRVARRRAWGERPIDHSAATCVDPPPGGDAPIAENLVVESVTVDTGSAEPSLE